jgi:AcrR family transcriptional regulator
MKKITASSRPARTASTARRSGAGYARGQETKLRIIEAALELFGAKGFDQVSTRDIAARAGVNAPALQYYFDGKEGLYIACAEYMAAHARELMAPAVQKVRAVLEGKPGTDALIECVWTLIERAADAMLLSRRVDAWARFMAWEDLRQDRPRGGARAVIEKSFRREVNGLMRTALARITGAKPDDTQTRIRALTLMSQITIFFAMREKALEDIGWSSLDESRLKTLKAIIRSQTVSALKAAAKERR